MMSKEFLKKVGILGVSFGLIASPLAFGTEQQGYDPESPEQRTDSVDSQEQGGSAAGPEHEQAPTTDPAGQGAGQSPGATPTEPGAENAPGPDAQGTQGTDQAPGTGAGTGTGTGTGAGGAGTEGAQPGSSAGPDHEQAPTTDPAGQGAGQSPGADPAAPGAEQAPGTQPQDPATQDPGMESNDSTLPEDQDSGFGEGGEAMPGEEPGGSNVQ